MVCCRDDSNEITKKLEKDQKFFFKKNKLDEIKKRMNEQMLHNSHY